MKKKTIVSTALFVIIGVVALIVSVYAASETTGKNGKNGSASAPAQENTGDRELTVYYFHGNKRCGACRAIEKYTREAVQSGFPDEIKKGKVEMKAVNIDKKENEHYIRDYQLTTKSVVLSSTESGEETDWKNLSKVWKLIRKKEKFISYVQEEAKKLYNGGTDG